MNTSSFSFPPLSIEERQYLALWASVPGVGRKTLRRIVECAIKRNVTLGHIWEKPEGYEKLFKPGGDTLKALNVWKERYSVASYQDFLKIRRIHTIYLDDSLYPRFLKEIDEPPFILFALGNRKILNALDKDQSIAIVGTRQITSYGVNVTKQITSYLVNKDCVIVSGGMYGVDQTAHAEAMNHKGKSIAVIGYGFCHINQCNSFFKDFLESQQLVISEYAPEKGAAKGSFIARNRIVAGLSQATVVIEAGDDSGSLHTARFAKNYGRLVCAVPGHINNEFSAGTRKLFNNGAKAVASGEEILELLHKKKLGLDLTLDPDNYKKHHKPKPKFTNQLHQKIYNLLSCQPLFTEEIAAHVKEPFHQVLLALSEMEIAKHITQGPGRWEVIER